MLKLLIILTLLLGVSCCSAFAESTPALPELPDKLPAEYTKAPETRGTVLQIEYPSKDYNNDQREITKPALVYLPAGYSEERFKTGIGISP